MVHLFMVLFFNREPQILNLSSGLVFYAFSLETVFFVLDKHFFLMN